MTLLEISTTIKRSVTISDVVRRYADPSAPRGKGRIPCPIHHGEHKNFSYDDSDGLYNCFSRCGGGDIFSFVESVCGDNFFESAKRLNADFGLCLPMDEREAVAVVGSVISRKDTRSYGTIDILDDMKQHLELDSNGRVKTTTGNYLSIMRFDPFFEDVRHDVVLDKAVIGSSSWTDTDKSRAINYIEQKYHIFHEAKFKSAFDEFSHEREFDPIKEAFSLIEEVDPAIESMSSNFFSKWLGAKDDAYTHEVTRLFFASGIERAFHPGSKVDNVLVLVGDQGCGKSTICEWLSPDPEFYGSTRTITGKTGIEALFGKFIVELEELLATQRAETVEEVKRFLTLKKDTYRRPWATFPKDYPRHCVFIGTTNRHEFLSDKTGNRRWFPLEVHGDGADLHRREAEVKKDIATAWGEMLFCMRRSSENKGFADWILPVASSKLRDVIEEHREAATEDDWRVGAIREYIEENDKNTVCIRELITVLYPLTYETTLKTRAESNQISAIMRNNIGWIRSEKLEQTAYGRQMVFKKPK